MDIVHVVNDITVKSSINRCIVKTVIIKLNINVIIRTSSTSEHWNLDDPNKIIAR